VYWWQGKVEEDREDLLVVKTSAERMGELVRRVREIHPYEVPEIVALPVAACLGDYCKWVREETAR